MRGVTVKARTAIFIDCENVPAKFWPEIEARAAALGHINLCRLYGDFTEDRLTRWLDIARENCLQPILQLGGKNAADITIAGMDLLHQGKTEAMVLVSSDQDLSALAHRLRGAGIKVLGLGNANTPVALRKACSEFLELGHTPPTPATAASKPPLPNLPPAPQPVAVKAA